MGPEIEGKSPLICEFVIISCSFGQAFTTAKVFEQIRRKRKTCGFSINTQCLCMLALAFKYLDVYQLPEEYKSAPNLPYLIQYWVNKFFLIIMLATYFISITFAEYIDDKFDLLWIFGGMVTSFVLGLDNITIYLTERDRWMIGSYLDVIVWIPQFKWTLKNPPFNTDVCMNIWCTVFLDIVTITGFSYDYYRHNLYGNMGCKLVILKLLLCFGFFYKYAFSQRTAKEATSELSVCYSAGKSSDKIPLVYIIDNIPKNKHGLMSPN